MKKNLSKQEDRFTEKDELIRQLGLAKAKLAQTDDKLERDRLNLQIKSYEGRLHEIRNTLVALLDEVDAMLEQMLEVEARLAALDDAHR